MNRIAPALFIVILAGVAALLLFSPWQKPQLDGSPIGYKGLAFWLPENGVPVTRSNAHVGPSRGELSMRILPLSTPDTDDNGTNAGKTGAPELPAEILEEKIYELTTLFVLPKWQASVALDERLQESSLFEPKKVAQSYSRLGLGPLTVKRLKPAFTQADVTIGTGAPIQIASFSAQFFDRSSLPDFCSEVIGWREGALLLRCDDVDAYYLLSDPDLINNHGLTIADNAGFALKLVTTLRGADSKLPIYLDMDTTLLSDVEPADEGRSYERTTSDLLRYFEYPLTIVWGLIILLALISFWRGSFRFGPALPSGDADIELSKSAAVAATARLLRLSGSDGRMVAQFVQDLLFDKAITIFGPGFGNPNGVARLFQYLSRRDKEAANSLQQISTSLIDGASTMHRTELHNNLIKFRTLLRSFDSGPQ